MARAKKYKKLSLHRKIEIAKYIVKNQHLTHKQRAYYLGISYTQEYDIYKEFLVTYSVVMLRHDVITDLPQDALYFQTYLGTSE